VAEPAELVLVQHGPRVVWPVEQVDGGSGGAQPLGLGLEPPLPDGPACRTGPTTHST
jgi:hypothetical protein